ncbi:MAG: hypothetical protein IJH39_05890 [Clostridia bacterium]|nr:hypothetical protein [Clostridia bacterium]
MTYIAINTIGDYPEDFLTAKVDVEHYLIETGEIEKRMRLDEFIVYLNIQKTIYMKGQKSIAFRIIKGENDEYVFYSLLDNDEELFDLFKSALEKLKYDFSSLKKIEPIELIQLDLSKEEVFMFDFVVYK